ncbi:hypothetical protein GO755_40350 [Spirosoma sp. HMF4905]|uniref:Peptidoglycan binding-like domain-containing protein n=1 Tax=Spirosoma arboris TaxID=2682092 RepID=A0A7K1SR82_9BACT|nr:peptidoglycan-binding protein [Spirosoma arboris]MVM36325.1 hypothetical protein [Spirosoma arboris]
MDRILFAKPAKGDLIRKIQRHLTDSSFDTHGMDGTFGVNTELAVINFQKQNELPPTGLIDLKTYTLLTGEEIPSVQERTLQLTAAFEGHDYTLAQGNFDGAGITWGIIGFTLLSGKLKKIIQLIHQRKPSLVADAFQEKMPELLSVLKSPLKQQLAFGNSISIGSSKVRLAEPWRSAFARFGEMEEVKALQRDIADQDFFQPALQTAHDFDLKTELGTALTFDIHVQNGSIKEMARKQIDRETKAHPITKEQDLRVILANAVADQSRPVFREDVRSRKLTLATGSGKVHGEQFILRNWGLDELEV